MTTIILRVCTWSFIGRLLIETSLPSPIDGVLTQPTYESLIQGVARLPSGLARWVALSDSHNLLLKQIDAGNVSSEPNSKPRLLCPKF